MKLLMWNVKSATACSTLTLTEYNKLRQLQRQQPKFSWNTHNTKYMYIIHTYTHIFYYLLFIDLVICNVVIIILTALMLVSGFSVIHIKWMLYSISQYFYVLFLAFLIFVECKFNMQRILMSYYYCNIEIGASIHWTCERIFITIKNAFEIYYWHHVISMW